MLTQFENSVARRLSAGLIKLAPVFFLLTVVPGILNFWAPVAAMAANTGRVSGTLKDPQGQAVAGALIGLVAQGNSARREARTDESGEYSFISVATGEYSVTAEFAGFDPIVRTALVHEGGAPSIDLQFRTAAPITESVSVTADMSDIGIFVPDPAERIMVRDETLDANPGRPGMPVSIPGMPVESPAGGIKPPQYFIPGVAGDHGEPIAMFFQVGNYLFQNNLPANAHGNGYADPNVIIPIAIDNIQTDGGAFNVREGNNSENAAITFGLRSRLEPMLRLTGDYRDLDLVSGWSPANPADKFWVGAEVSYGNGFLKRLEHRKQYKVNLSKVFESHSNDLYVYGIGYYGFAYQPGLIPIDVPVPGDTIDARQQEKTANGAVIFNDVWSLSQHRQFQFSGFYRYYTLDVRPDFGYIPEAFDCGAVERMPDCGTGLIRQSEHRNVNSEDILYSDIVSTRFAFLAGLDLRREAPSALDLDRADDAGRFYPVTANNLVMNFYSPYISADGALTHFIHYNLGYRRDNVGMNNKDIYRPTYSFLRNASINSPKGTITLIPPASMRFLPEAAYSYGESFHVNDPRIGTAAIMGSSVVSKARSQQVVVTKTAMRTDFRLTLEHVTTAQSLARISNDTGLQEDEGPGLLKSLSVTARHNFASGFIQGLFARADARDRQTGEPIPEAPRLIWDVLATIERLPGHLVARGEYEQVGRKPLGDGFVAVPVREFRGAVSRSFPSKSMDLGINFLIASGYGGQTLETFSLPGEGDAFERIAGFPVKSYATGSVTYHFGGK